MTRRSASAYSFGRSSAARFSLGRLIPIAASVAMLFSANAAAEWRDVTDVNLEVVAGSALDFSELFGPVQTGMNNPANPANRRVRLNADGNLSLDGTQPHRLLCAAVNFAGPWGEFPDNAGAEKLALEMRRRGYNVARVHHVESALMEGVAKSKNNDLKFNSTRKNRLYNLLKVLKTNGIEWMLDVVSDDNAAWGLVGGNRARNTDFRTKLYVHYDPAYQTHWKNVLNNLWNQDYDGSGPGGKILADPALTSLTLVNELSIIYNTRKQPGDQLPNAMKDEMIAWAAAKSPPVAITREQIPPVTDRVSPRMPLLLEFLSWKEKQTVDWMSPYVKARSGNALLLVGYNNGRVVQAQAARGYTDAANTHGYHEAEGRPDRSLNISSFSDTLQYLQTFSMSRVLGKPLVIDEYDIPYWNEWRREAGIAAPAYAALQGWDGLCRYSNPITFKYQRITGVERSERIYPFSIGMDPVARAGETLSALLFRRGDVARSPNLFTINLTDAFLHSQISGDEFMPTSIGRLALLSRVAINRTGANSPTPGPFSFTPSPSLIGPPETQAAAWQTNFAKWKETAPDNPSFVTTRDEYYVSDTGELETLIERRTNPTYRMSVRTPRTEAYVFQSNRLPPRQTNDRLSIDSSNRNALVSLSSVDKLAADGTGAALQNSKRFLMIIATDALNSDAVFSNPQRAEQLERGELPVQIETVRLQLSVRLDPTKTYTVYPLNLNGSRRPKSGGGFQTLQALPLGDGTGFGLTIDTGAVNFAPTTFFEIERNG